MSDTRKWLDEAQKRCDNEFGLLEPIALATKVLPRALSALRAVLDLHTPYDPTVQKCRECNADFPCQTLGVIEAAIHPATETGGISKHMIDAAYVELEYSDD